MKHYDDDANEQWKRRCLNLFLYCALSFVFGIDDNREENSEWKRIKENKFSAFPRFFFFFFWICEMKYVRRHQVRNIATIFNFSLSEDDAMYICAGLRVCMSVSSNTTIYGIFSIEFHKIAWMKITNSFRRWIARVFPWICQAVFT